MPATKPPGKPHNIIDYPLLDQIDAITFFERARHTGRGFNDSQFTLAVHGAGFSDTEIQLLRQALVALIPRERLMREHRLSRRAVTALVDRALDHFRKTLSARGFACREFVVPPSAQALLERLEYYRIQLSIHGIPIDDD